MPCLGPGADYLALWQNWIWHTSDGLICALLTAGMFGWLWPA